jgi:thiol:disulfide interchange protein DsbD
MIAAPLSSQLSSHPFAGLAVAFGGGLLASLSPCLYPMIPITLSIIGGTRASSRAQRLGLALVYVAGLASTYSLLGLIAGLTGTMFGAISTNPWLYFAMANVMLLAAAMMADVIAVPVPASVQQRAASVGTGGRVGGAFAMGAVSGLVAAPCGAPVMAGILTWVTTTRSGVLGFFYLLAFSLGMCALLLVFALVADTALRLPRPGAWMIGVKRVFALVLLGVAEYYLISMGQLIV